MIQKNERKSKWSPLRCSRRLRDAAANAEILGRETKIDHLAIQVIFYGDELSRSHITDNEFVNIVEFRFILVATYHLLVLLTYVIKRSVHVNTWIAKGCDR